MDTDLLLPWLSATGADGERHSMQAFAGDGTTGPWDFNFAGGYIAPAHVRAYRYDPASATTVPQTLTFLGPNRVTTGEPIPAGQYIVIYRDTPKNTPLVDYTEGAVLNEANLDTTAQQSVFAAAEMVDRFAAMNTDNTEAVARSVLALDTANTALATANTAAADASAAVTTANTASSNAASAASTADAAAAVASGVDAKAQTALDNSLAAVSTANSASATANGVDAKATQAQADAAAAVTTANAALAATAVDISGKVDIDSPAFTGTPTAPTPDAADDSARLATTAYVKAAVSQGGGAPAPHTHTAADIFDAGLTGMELIWSDGPDDAWAALGKPDISEGTVGLMPQARIVPPLGDGVGCWAIACASAGVSCFVGMAISGANLRRVLLRHGNGAYADPNLVAASQALPGTWRNMGKETVSGTVSALFVRIA